LTNIFPDGREEAWRRLQVTLLIRVNHAAVTELVADLTNEAETGFTICTKDHAARSPPETNGQNLQALCFWQVFRGDPPPGCKTDDKQSMRQSSAPSKPTTATPGDPSNRLYQAGLLPMPLS